MRVIAGKYRSRPLRSLRGLDLRPTADRLRETLFDVLTAGNPAALEGKVWLGSLCGNRRGRNRSLEPWGEHDVLRRVVRSGGGTDQGEPAIVRHGDRISGSKARFDPCLARIGCAWVGG